MAIDKAVDSAKLDAALNATAKAIQSKTGGTSKIPWNASTGFASAVEQIKTGSSLETSTITGFGSAVGGTVYYIDANGQGQQYGATEWTTVKAIKGSYVIADFAYAADGFYLDGYELVAAYGPFATSANDGANNYVIILKITGDNPTAMI